MNKSCDDVICLCIRMTQDANIRLVTQICSEVIISLPEHLVLFNFSLSRIYCDTISLIRLVEFLAPRTTLKTEDDMINAKLTHDLIDRREREVHSHANLFPCISVARGNVTGAKE